MSYIAVVFMDGKIFQPAFGLTFMQGVSSFKGYSMSEDNHNNQPTGIIEYLKSLPLGAFSIMFALGGLTIFGLTALQQGIQQPAPIYIQPAASTATPLPTSTPTPVKVFINGEVNRPGVYELPHDSILQDALVLSGGFTDDAYEDIINLAQPLTDGMQVYVPAVSDNALTVPLVSTPPVVGKTESSQTESQGGIINLNTATKEQLETLPGVGPSTAQKILDYREDNGVFSSIEDVMNVSGIGPAKFENVASYITVEG
ncbi:MAG: competence protein ComEA [Cellvibrionaceae bacterium]|jgi:competence protein ComEA